MKLSEHFRLDEFTVSELAARRGMANMPGAEAIAQLRSLCQLVLEPLRRELGRPVVITSGYRSPELNAAVGGSPNSLHLQGRAADLIVPGVAPLAVCEAARRLKLPCAEIIHEFGRWAHLAVGSAGGRPKILTASLAAGKTQYRDGLHHV